MTNIEGKILTKLEKVSDMTQSWADKVKNNPPHTAQSVSNIPSTNELSIIMKEALDETKKNDSIMEEKQKSVIIYRVNESTKETGEERKREEGDLIDRLCREGVRVQGCKVVKSFRIGKYERNVTKSRPLKVVFETKDQQQRLLANLRNLKEAERDLNCLSISPDLTKEAREEIKQKVQEAKERTRNSPDKVYLVRGTPGHMRIIEVKKK